MAFPRVLVVTGSAGHGHVKAAQAVAAALRDRHPQIDVAEMDALEKMPRWFARTYRAGYIRLVDKNPVLWRAFYESTDRADSAVGHALTMLGGRRMVRSALRWKPDVVVCTHFLAPELLAREVRLGRTKAELHVVITDFDCHRAWWRPEVARYYVASEVVKARLVYRFGVPTDRVHVTGIPIDAAFGVRRDVVATRARHGLDPQRPTVLFLSGGFAAGPMARAIVGVWADRPDAQVVAVCGKNARLLRRVKALPRPAGALLVPLGFTNEVPDLMAAADVVVSKSGGLSTSECMASGRPMVISASIPGQEERNADAVVGAGAGVRALSTEEVRWQVVRLLSRPDDLRSIALRARAFGRPFAAEDVADRVASSLGVDAPWMPPAHGAPASSPRQGVL